MNQLNVIDFHEKILVGPRLDDSFEKFAKIYSFRNFEGAPDVIGKRNRMLFCHIFVCDTTMFAIRPTRGYIIKTQLWNSFNFALIARTLHRLHVIGIALTVVRIHFITRFIARILRYDTRSFDLV